MPSLNAEELKSVMDNELNGVTEHGCSGCLRTVSEGITVRKCGRCKVRHYCSRECQVKDWPSHKQTCMIKTPQQANVLRAIETVQKNPKVMENLRAAIALYFLGKFKAYPEKKEWIAVVSLFVRPYDNGDYQALMQPSIDLAPLLSKTMPGHTVMVGIHEHTDLEGPGRDKIPEYFLELWANHRLVLQSIDMEDSCSFLVHFSYHSTLIHSTTIAVHPQDIANAQRIADLHQGLSPIGAGNIPLRLVNAFLTLEEEHKQKLKFDLVDADKTFLRELVVSTS